MPALTSLIKAPDRCPFCNAPKLTTKGSRAKSRETVRIYRCLRCDRTFTPGPQALRNKSFPATIIIAALTAYNRGHSLEDTAERITTRYGYSVHASTVSRWLKQFEPLLSYGRVRPDRRYTPAQMIRTTKLYHRQVYEYAYHRDKLDRLRELANTRRLAALAAVPDFLERIPRECPHELFVDEHGERSSQIKSCFPNLDRLVVTQRSNAATEAAALIIPSVGTNHERHPKLQSFMLANDLATLAIEVPIWLDNDAIAALEDEYGVELVPRSYGRRTITGHIDFLQYRSGALHILDYKPDARTNKPIVQLAIYALALTRLIPGLRLFDIKCAWFNENAYCEFYPRQLLQRTERMPSSTIHNPQAVPPAAYSHINTERHST